MRLHVQEKNFDGITVLKDIDLHLHKDETTVLLGPSGCGKTTLLRIICGLDTDFDGQLDLDSEKIGFVFQEPRLLPWLSVYDNIALVCADGVDIDGLLKDVGVLEAKDQLASKLSLGMARRVGFARALSINPDVLIMDEPFVSLDQARAEQLRLMVLDVMAKRSTKVLFVTHDLGEAVQLGSRILHLGGTPSRILQEKQVALSPEMRRNPRAIADIVGQFALS
ncbi:ATP-binding cassette domain-containing protein [Terasakiella sp. A23]|uniref:ABC transporter ATP-binding protein n=1 Tax=Terasakiella sp. FCG-A23 TaxID=3080561 RepID=UPI002954E209|nr:ATP-binding cassette domain-containing protein [Terasakiella sp. A23]MDV7339332.1 ATP-binding cassette domain-containing protein [Terasakiella sp. A23]